MQQKMVLTLYINKNKNLGGNIMYRRSFDSFLIMVEGKFIITNSLIHFEVNEVGARIFDLCDGTNNERTISKKLSNHYNMNIETIKNDVRNYIKELTNLNLITLVHK